MVLEHAGRYLITEIDKLPRSIRALKIQSSQAPVTIITMLKLGPSSTCVIARMPTALRSRRSSCVCSASRTPRSSSSASSQQPLRCYCSRRETLGAGSCHPSHMIDSIRMRCTVTRLVLRRLKCRSAMIGLAWGATNQRPYPAHAISGILPPLPLVGRSTMLLLPSHTTTPRFSLGPAGAHGGEEDSFSRLRGE